jgi:Rad3-related DNA helicase
MDILKDITSDFPNYVFKEGEQPWRAGGYMINGTKMKRGDEYILPTLMAKPLDISRYGATIWPDRTQKLILLSATISRRDILDLGLGRRRMMQINCTHPIPPNHRPIIYDPVDFVKHDNLEDATRKIVEHVEEHMIPHHEGEKGLIHATYEQSRIIRKYAKSDRFMFHTPLDKAQVYEEWQASDPSLSRVLVACGMYEGLDLPEDLGRWQVLAKIPWPSLLEPAIAKRAEADEEWYQWTTLKDTIQAAGRICRTPEDFGVTYICDATFGYLRENTLIPDWFTEAIEDYSE